MDHKKLSDSQLFGLVAQDNRLAFNELFERYWQSLLSSALKVLNDELAAEDIVQELFIDLWDRRHHLEIKSFKGYLHTAIRYQSAKIISRTRFTSDHELALERIETHLHPESDLQLADLHHQIDASLEKLTPRVKEIFVQSRFENLSNKEIAERNGISIRTVENHLTTALAEFRLSFGKNSAISTTAIFLILL